MDNNSVIMQWNLDEHGNPTSRRIDREIQQVSTTHNLIQLTQIPDSSQRIIILMVDPKTNTQQELQETLNKKDLNSSNFYVEYGMGLILFSDRWQGCTAYISYYGRGVMLISDSRIFHKKGSTFYDTYDNIIDRGLDAIRVLDAAGGLQGAIDRLQELGDEGNAIADRLQEFITETQFYGYTIILTREAFVVKSDNDGLVESNEVNGCYTDVIAYQGAKQVAPVLSVGTCDGCEVVVVDGFQRFRLKSINQNIIKAQANVYLDFGDNLIAQRTLEFTKVFDGVDPYQVEMTNPFMAIQTSQNGDILDNQEIECEVIVTKAGEPVDINSYTVEVQNNPLNLYNEVHENKVKFSVRSGSNFPSGTCLVVVKIGRQTINKTFGWSMVKSGHDAKSLVVVGNQVLKYQMDDYSDIPQPSLCTVTAQVSGLSGTPVWSKLVGDSWEVLDGQNSTTLSFYHNDFSIWGNDKQVTVKCELGGYSDELTIVKLAPGKNGENAVTIFLTNESITIPMSENGQISEYDIRKCYTTVKVYKGNMEVTPDISVPLSSNYSVNVENGVVTLMDIERSTSTVDIEIRINVDGVTYTKVWSIGKAQQGARGEDGANGSSYTIIVEGGTTSITYSQINQMPRPEFSQEFYAYLYKDGQLYNGEVSWYWSTTGHLSGTGLHEFFAPTIAEYFDESIANNSVVVNATCEGARVSTIIPISVTKDAAGLDWVEEWDGTKVEINDTTVLTPKLFAGIVEPSETTGEDTVSGVAIGADVLNNGTNVGIVGYQQDKVSFLLDVDGTLQVGNFYEPDGVGIVYDNGRLDIKVSELSITGSDVATKEDVEASKNDAINSAKEEVQLEISEVMSSIGEIESYINGAFQDGILTEVEKNKFIALYENLEQETKDINSLFLSVVNNPYLLNEELRTLLDTEYENYHAAFSNITVAYHTILAGGLEVVEEEEDETGEPVYYIAVVEDFNEALTAFRASSELLRQYLNDGLLNISEKQAESIVAAARLEITQEIDDVSNALDALDTTMNTEFKTGLITYVNQQNLDAKLNQLKLEKVDIDSQYNVMYYSNALPNDKKVELVTIKSDLDAIHDILIERIEAAIADSLMTEAEIAKINELMETYGTCLSYYSTKAQECNIVIAQSAVDNMTQTDVFNKLTNNGEIQGIFMDGKQLYINGEYVNTRNLVAVRDDDVETFKVDSDGNVHITAKTFTLQSGASTNLSEFLNLDDVNFDQEAIFNALTNNGQSQGIYMVNDQLYINGQYVNAKGLSVTNDKGAKTFEIDANGNVSIVANSFSVAVGGSGNVATKDDLTQSLADAKQYADSVVSGAVTGAINVLMSNPVQVIATNVSFFPLTAQTYTTTFQVFQGATEITNYTIQEVSSNHGLTVTQTNNSISFTTSKTTKIDESGSFDIYIVVGGISYKQTFSFTAARQGDTGEGGSSCSVKIIASSNIFKSPDGGLQFTPDNITLKPILQNLTYSAWQYSVDGGTTWNGFTNSITGWSVSNQVLTISKSCSLFTDTVTSIAIKVVTTDDTYYDIVTVVRLYDVSQLEIGGTNLLPDSTNDLETWGYKTTGYMSHNAILNERSSTGNSSRQFRTKDGMLEYVTPKTGETYTLSAMVYIDSKIALNKDSNNIYMRLWFDDDTYYDACAIQITNSMTKNTWLQLHKTEKLNFTKTIASVVVQFALQDAGSLRASMIKLEKGNLCTAWSPSPSDSYTTKDVQTLVTQTKDSITQTVAATYTTQEAFNNLSVGGRNLAQRTSNLWSDYYTGFTGEINYCINNTNVLIEDLKVGDSICYSVEVECTDLVIASGQTATIKVQGSGDVTSWNSGAFPASPAQTLQAGTYTITLKHTAPIIAAHLQNIIWKTNIRVDYVQSGKMRVRNFKVEKGNIYTAWTPAPEDVDTMIDAARTTAIDEAVAAAGQDVDVKLNSYATKTDVSTSIKQTQDSITQAVEKTYETKTNATAQYNGMTTSINSLTTRMTNAESKITDSAIINTVSGTYTTKTDFDTKTKALQGEIDAAEKDIDNVEQSVSTLTTRVFNAEQKITEDAITSTVSKTFVKQTDYNSKVSSIETRVTNAEQKITDEAIVNTVSKSNTFTKKTDFDNMKIGGENLILNSNWEKGLNVNWSSSRCFGIDGSDSSLKYIVTDGSTSDERYKHSDAISVDGLHGRDLAFSCEYWVQKVSTRPIAMIAFFELEEEIGTSECISFVFVIPNSSDMALNTWNRATHIITVPNNVNFVRVSACSPSNEAIWWRRFQLQIGGVATDWSPSPTDVGQEVDDLKSQVQANTESIASLQINADNISMSVKEIQTNTEEAIEALNGNIGTLTNKVEMAMTSTDVKFLIQEEMENGIDSITTETGYTFDKNGLTISKTNSELSTIVDEDGMTIKKNNSEVMLDVNNQGVEAQNVTVDTYLIVGNKSRFEKYGSNRIGCFWIG